MAEGTGVALQATPQAVARARGARQASAHWSARFGRGRGASGATPVPSAALTLVVLLLTVTHAGAASITARLDPPRVRTGESADLAVTIEGVQNAPAPTIAQVDGVTMQYVGPETQVSIVNGKMSGQITHHFTVTGRREGTFTIGPISVQHEGKTLGAGSVTLQVAAGAAGAGGAPQNEQLQLVLGATKTSLYVNERLPLTLSLRVGSVRVTDLKYPTIPGDGFALDPLAEPTQRQDGTFQVVDFRTALTPLRAGVLTVGPATMSLSQIVQRQGGRRGLFAFGGGMQQPVTLESAPMQLDVLPLPTEGRPADFTGAVGQFTLEVRAAPLDVAAGDPVTLTFTVRGEGNLAGTAPAGVAASDAVRVYPVAPASQQRETSPGTIDRVFEQVIIPQRAGPLPLARLGLSFFDPTARAYRTVRQAPIALTVRAPAGGGSAPQIVGGAATTPARPAETLGRDIVFIKDAPGTLAPAHTPRWRSAGFWLLQLVPLIALLGARWLAHRRRRLGTDERYARFTRAGRTVRAELAAARTALDGGQAAAFYDRVARALQDYLAAKLDLPPGGVTAESAGARLRGTRVPSDVVDELRAVLATCEQVRFAPAAGDGDMRRTLERADAVVRALERERRLTVAAAGVLLCLGVALGAVAARADDWNASAVFIRANGLYAQGDYAGAARAYEELLAHGLASANLYYNLGNAYLKAGDVGQAVLSYERARLRAPRDPDVLANLRFARGDDAEAEAPSLLVRLLVPLASRATGNELWLAAATLWWLAAGLLIATYFAPAGERALRRAAATVAVVLLVVVASAMYRLRDVELAERAVVVAPADVTVRFEPTTSGTAHFDAKPGSVLRVLGERPGWRQVVRPDGARGWVPTDALAMIEPSSA